MNPLKKTAREPFWLVLVVLFAVETACLSGSYFNEDGHAFLSWAEYVKAHGIGHAYQQPGYNYPPLIAYPLWLWANCFGSDAALGRNFFYFKLFPLAGDFAAAAFAAKWAGGPKRALGLFLLLAANPLYLYNTYYWGQVDTVQSALIFFCFYQALRDRPVWAMLLFILAINFKIQCLVFAPPFALILLWKFNRPWTSQQVAAAFGAAAVLQLAILFPFIRAGELGHLVDVLRQSFGQYASLSLNAFNFWQLIYGHAAYQINDTTVLLAGLSARQIGLAIFCGLSFAVLWPFFWRVLRSRFSGQPLAWNLETLLLMFALIPLLFFFFNTEMHERYVHPAIIFVAAYSFLTRRYYLLALALVAYGLNLEFVAHMFYFENYQGLLFNSRLIASFYAILILLLGHFYYRSLPQTTPARAT